MKNNPAGKGSYPLEKPLLQRRRSYRDHREPIFADKFPEISLQFRLSPDLLFDIKPGCLDRVKARPAVFLNYCSVYFPEFSYWLGVLSNALSNALAAYNVGVEVYGFDGLAQRSEIAVVSSASAALFMATIVYKHIRRRFNKSDFKHLERAITELDQSKVMLLEMLKGQITQAWGELPVPEGGVQTEEEYKPWSDYAKLVQSYLHLQRLSLSPHVSFDLYKRINKALASTGAAKLILEANVPSISPWGYGAALFFISAGVGFMHLFPALTQHFPDAKSPSSLFAVESYLSGLGQCWNTSISNPTSDMTVISPSHLQAAEVEKLQTVESASGTLKIGLLMGMFFVLLSALADGASSTLYVPDFAKRPVSEFSSLAKGLYLVFMVISGLGFAFDTFRKETFSARASDRLSTITSSVGTFHHMVTAKKESFVVVDEHTPV